MRRRLVRAGASGELGSVALLAATSLLALVGALAHWQLVTIAALAASVLCEPLVQRYAPTFGRLLGQADLGPTTRAALRGGVVALAGVGLWESRWPAVAFAVVFGAYLLLHCVHAFCVAQLRKSHSRPVLTRNVDTAAGAREVWGIRPHRWRREVPAQLAVVVPAICVTEGSWVVWVLGTLAVTLQMMLVIGPVADVLASRTARGDGVRKPKMVPIQTFIDDYRPEVVLHLSGSKTSAYQVNVWLPTLERLRQRTLIVLRDDELFHALDATSLPVICAASGSDLMSLDLSHVRVALFPTNIGNNIHILRLPTLMSAFIGHGDSDKSASAIPYARVYDEIWVAGEAGADRYRRAALGIADDAFVRVGRPQITDVETASQRPPPPVPTVLYAPTWEGWNSGQAYYSVLAIGDRLVEHVLSMPGRLRLVYRPHPLIGARDPRVRDAHLQIVRRIEAANTSGRTDGAYTSTLSVTLDPEGSAVAEQAAHALVDRSFWEGLDPAAHVVVQPGASDPTLVSCFNESSALVADISSVLSDFVASEKPYAVFNPTHTDADRFVADFPSAAAGTTVMGDGTGIEEFVAVVAGDAPDDRMTDRSRLAEYLLGPATSRTFATFQHAVDALCDRAGRERAPHRA